MEKGILVKDIMAGAQVEGIFIVKTASPGQTRTGAPYWNLTLADASGSMEAKIWSPLSTEFREFQSGLFVEVGGNAAKYRDKCQVVIDRLKILDEGQQAGLSMADFMPATPYGIPGLFSELLALINKEFTHKPWLELLQAILLDPAIRDAFCMAPAATGIHHAYAGGLLEHTLSVATLCRMFADKYPELDRQTLLAGAILHDIGKTRELTAGLAREYTQEGHLLGHIFLGLSIISPFLAESRLEPWLREHLQHLILSHHGQFEFGSPRLPQTAEAFALHYADNLDARLAQCRSLFAGADARPAWSAWQKTLNRSILYPQVTPVMESEPGAVAAMDMQDSPDEMEYYAEELETEPSPEDLAELYADPAFNDPTGLQGNKACQGTAAGQYGQPTRTTRQDVQCSLL